MSTVTQFGRWETVFALASGVATVTLTGPGGQTGQRPVFRHQPVRREYDQHGYERLVPNGAPVLAVRFTPDQVGTWQWIAWHGTEEVTRGHFDCTPALGAGFVGVSPHDARYFAHQGGEPYVPIGLNLCGSPQDRLTTGREFSQGTDLATLGIREYERWFAQLAAHGGNYARLWLSRFCYPIEGEVAGDCDLVALAGLDAVIAAARRYDIRLKLCIEHFRRVTPGDIPPVFVCTLRDPETGAAPLDMDAWFQQPRWQELWWRKVDAYLARYADDPVVFAWELWNEIDCCHTSTWAVQRDWTAATLTRLKSRTPRNLVTNSLGSFDWPGKRALQHDFHYPPMDFQQVHRYLDQGAALAVCQADTVELCRDAVVQSRRPDRPIMLTETGAVNDCHTGPFRYYRWDHDGLIFHDVTYAPFFAGAAASGHIWHWDSYVDQKNLWPGFRALADLLQGVAVDREQFHYHDCSTADWWCWLLRGRTCTLGWVRVRADRWDHVLRDGVLPPVQTPVIPLAALPLQATAVALYRPWPDDAAGHATLTHEALCLPPLRHGVVFRLTHA